MDVTQLAGGTDRLLLAIPDSASIYTFLEDYIIAAGCALVWWDWMITFQDEVTHIWPSKWSTVKVIFLANRYGNLLLQVVLIMHILGLNPAYSQMGCYSHVLGYGIFAFLSLASIHVLVIVRVWAIWGRQPWITAILIGMYVAYAAACIALIIYTIATVGDRFVFSFGGTCISLTPPNLWYIWLPCLLLEVSAFILTWASLKNHHKDTCPQLRTLSPIPRQLRRSARFFVTLNSLCHVFNMVLWARYGTRPFNVLAATFVYCLLNVGGQRFVLDLRRLNAGRTPVSQSTARLSDMVLPVFFGRSRQ